MTSKSPEPTDNSEIVPPVECVALRTAYKKSGLTVADLSAATGLSTATIYIALSGIRYRNGVGKATRPPDSTVVKLAGVLRVHPDALRAVGRDRAAELLEEVEGTSERLTSASTIVSDETAKAAAAARAALARQVLAAFATEDLRLELDRRERADDEAHDREVQAELLADLRQDAGQP